MMRIWRLSVTYIRPKSRTEGPSKTRIGTEVAHVARDWDTTFKVKGRGHQAALLTAVLARLHQPAAAVAELTVGKYWPWERKTLTAYCFVALCRGRWHSVVASHTARYNYYFGLLFKKLGVGLLVVVIWLELWMSCSPSCHHLLRHP